MTREKHTLKALREIVAAASTLVERLEGAFIADDTAESGKLRQQRLERWRQMVAGKDQQRFQEILSWDGYDPIEVQRMLGHVMLPESPPLPEWARTLQEMLYQAESLSCTGGIVDKSIWCFLAPETPYPFEEILSPFVALADKRFAEQAGSAYHLLSDEAHVTLQRHLLQVLTSLSVYSLHAFFLQHRSNNQQVCLSEQAMESSGDASQAYQHFIAWLYQGGLIRFFQTYSFLARQLATTMDLWIEAHVELVQRLETDWQDLQYMLGDEEQPGQVIQIEPALSDPHQGRRCVMGLTFASGRRLIYKPRNIGMEVAFAHLLHWCNTHAAELPLHIPTMLDRTTYGWVAYVEHKECQSPEAVQRYYQRAGMLLCLVYLLGGTGYCYEQIIAHGEHPMLIDPTLLLHHYPCPDHQERQFAKQCSDWEQQQYSVLHTGLLSTWQLSLKSSQRWSMPPGTEISGLMMREVKKGIGMKQANSRHPQDPQPLKHGMLRVHERLNTVIYNASSYAASTHCEAVCLGFTQMYQLLLSNRHALLDDHGPLQAFRHQAVRVVYRESQAYRELFSKLQTPEYMHDGVEQSIELEQLWHAPIPVEYRCWREGASARWRVVCRAEQQALLGGDIPFFTAEVDSSVLVADQAMTSCLHQPAFDLLLQRVQHLSENDMHAQVRLIQQALRTDIAPVVGSSIRSMQDAVTVPGQSTVTALSSDILLASAIKIAETIAAQAVALGSGAVTWIFPQLLQRTQRYQLQSISYSLFNGACGIALFLAAAAKFSGEARYGALAKAAIQPLYRALHERGESLAREMGIGGALGLGSVVYSLTRIGQLLEEPHCLEMAHDAARWMSSEHIALDRALDVIAGSAGAILGLLALYHASGDETVLDRAILCANHLLQARTMSKADCLAWPTIDNTHTTGFSHGTAGIAYALLRLYRVTGDAALLDAVKEGLLYENQAFIPEEENWAESLADEEPTFMMTWCHGAPGIGLARIGGLPMLDSTRIRQDIDVALQVTQRTSLQGLDHLCCGKSGQTEILLTASMKLARPELAVIAQQNMEQLLSRAARQGTFLLNTSLPSWVPQPHFFHGLSGIGYTLLRMTAPETLPSVLLWE